MTRLTWRVQPDERRPMQSETSARGSPRQGTPLSEQYAVLEPTPLERLCPACAERVPEHSLADPRERLILAWSCAL